MSVSISRFIEIMDYYVRLELIVSFILTSILYLVSKLQLKVALRSVLNEEDEEMEIIPHVKMSKDFEVYDPIKLTPPISVMPWDDNIKPTYDLFFKVKYKNTGKLQEII